MSEEISAAATLAGLYDRIEALRARNHDLANEIMQERAKRMQAEADTAALGQKLNELLNEIDAAQEVGCWPKQGIVNSGWRIDATDRPGAALLAVAQAAAAFVEAGEYDDLASLLLELKEKVKEWRR